MLLQSALAELARVLVRNLLSFNLFFTSVKVYVIGLEKSMTAAPEDVTTTRLTDGALFLTAFRIPTVPSIAEERYHKQVVFWESGTTNLVQSVLSCHP